MSGGMEQRSGSTYECRLKFTIERTRLGKKQAVSVLLAHIKAANGLTGQKGETMLFGPDVGDWDKTLLHWCEHTHINSNP